MKDFLLLMHDDAVSVVSAKSWPGYFEALRRQGAFEGGSAIGGGECVRKDGVAGAVSSHLSGFIRVAAADLAAARGLVAGNPVFEAGGTVEIRELPRTG
jgi:hypothetical protein